VRCVHPDDKKDHTNQHQDDSGNSLSIHDRLQSKGWALPPSLRGTFPSHGASVHSGEQLEKSTYRRLLLQ
jgi:hypothetical protein